MFFNLILEIYYSWFSISTPPQLNQNKSRE